MDQKQKKYINLRKQSINNTPDNREFADLRSEDPFAVEWIRKEYELLSPYISKNKSSFSMVLIEMLDRMFRTTQARHTAEEAMARTAEELGDGVAEHLGKHRIELPPRKGNRKKRPLKEDNLDEFLRMLEDHELLRENRVCTWCNEISYLPIFLDHFAELDERMDLILRCCKSKIYSGRTRSFLDSCHLPLAKTIQTMLESRFSKETVLALLKYNPKHALFAPIAKREESGKRIQRHLLEQIPDSYVDLYPDARMIQRHFYIHHGPTNSGKTYQSVQRLMEAQNGIYAGPLRLLAYEIYDRLNKAGVYCSLLTGEESIDVWSSTVTASTVEMVNLSEDYDIVVVDEAQLISDKFRGGSWTRVILGVKAREIHLCCADEAVPVLTEMIRDCGDSYDLISHRRNTPLLASDYPFVYPDSIMPHDALIVFSRRAVHEVASFLQDKGYNCSMIYGNLPYDVRHKEAEKFISGQTDVLVSTDAIGLGLNLPIRRVVFLETEKFDGYQVRRLSPAEIKQIGGRAGRYGIFDKGFVSSCRDLDYIRECLDIKMPDQDYATIQFPETIIDIDAPMLDILVRWKEVSVNSGYRKADIEREIALCEMLKNYAVDKYFLYKAITIPFDDRNKTMLDLWLDMVDAEYRGQTMIPEVLEGSLVKGNHRLDYLELAYHVCDMLYNFSVKFRHEEYTEEIMNAKKKISSDIIRKLTRKQ